MHEDIVIKLGARVNGGDDGWGAGEDVGGGGGFGERGERSDHGDAGERVGFGGQEEDGIVELLHPLAEGLLLSRHFALLRCH
ncbi:hypothetical protein K469DRAFT_175189 [Zopfia rhizophila CBS 207.26]|uniref:Uncharacterized protein n=1 Tax=Zopfia rhizophila CBS 207.26 TaxID=1314779 RepID=A0A6A6DYW2_9PEZI|nr:hypothetical protein K469DRAFT_175189 [Zopfia rhizophila CBS 207.26]